jgi:hypothetical protein
MKDILVAVAAVSPVRGIGRKLSFTVLRTLQNKERLTVIRRLAKESLPLGSEMKPS